MDNKGAKRRSVPVGMKRRSVIVVAIMACLFMVLIGVLGYISIIKHDEYSSIATSQQLRDTPIAANRGTIYDSNMNVLAESATVWTVALSPMSIDDEDADKIAEGLSSLLDVDKETVKAKCGETNYYSIVKRKVDQPVVDRIREWMDEEDLGGITFTEDSKRYYPYGNFCSQVLGFVGTDNYGLYGLEAYYDSYLSGTSGRVISAKNAVGKDMYYEYETVYEAEDGLSLVLTIDEVIQHYLESALEVAVEEHNVKNRAAGIVMNVNTGEIYAMATKGDFDPNEPFLIYDDTVMETLGTITDESAYYDALDAAQELQWNNKAISEIYEPGSVFKALTASMALESGACSLDNSYYCPGYYQVLPGIVMNCAQTNGHGSEDFAQALINSCNPAFIQIGQSVGSTTFYDYFKAFGLTQRTAIDLPGESGSSFYTADGLGVVELASCSYGQSNAITPIQMITAFSAVVNGGYLVQPHLVKEVLDADGNIVESYGTKVIRQVISEETSDTMRYLLERVVSESNGRNAYVSGYRIGGKSGTSQKLGGQKGVYIASFCAFAPVDDPEVAVLILLDEANSYSIYGSTLVGPIVSSVMSEILPYLGVEAVYSEDDEQVSEVAVPYVTEASLTQAYSMLQMRGLTYEVIGDGTSVVLQYPGAGMALPEGSKVILYTDSDYEIKTAEVPDLSGRSVDSVETLLDALDLNLRIEGAVSSRATAVSQNYDYGDVVEAGTTITVTFVDNTLSD